MDKRTEKLFLRSSILALLATIVFSLITPVIGFIGGFAVFLAIVSGIGAIVLFAAYIVAIAQRYEEEEKEKGRQSRY